MSIEVREADDGIDEIIAYNVYLHFERMADDSWHLNIELNGAIRERRDDAS